MISYAQNFEDVMLWRAVGHVERGFYIDLGAQDPTVDSVSRVFYDQGWRGVHVEPTPGYAQALRAARPDESVLQVAVGLAQGLIPFFEFPDSGLSTGDQAIAGRHDAAGFANRRIDVPCIRLAELLDAHAERDIHWMKIDVEGMERSVLESWAPSSVRPWLLVIEATVPMSTELSHAEWEPLVLALGYRPCYFDGLNRFYVSQAHPELDKAFSCPPNVFDDFSLAGTASNRLCRHLNQVISLARHDVAHLQARQAELDAQLHAPRPAELAAQARLAELQQVVDERSARADQGLLEMQALSRQVAQTLVQLAAAKDETLQSLGLLAANQQAHLAQLERADAARDEVSGLQLAVAARDATIAEMLQQFQARLNSELVAQQHGFDLRLKAALQDGAEKAAAVSDAALAEQQGVAEQARQRWADQHDRLDAAHAAAVAAMAAQAQAAEVQWQQRLDEREQVLAAEHAVLLEQHGQRLESEFQQRLVADQAAQRMAHDALFGAQRLQIEAESRQQLAARELALGDEHALRMHALREQLQADLRAQLAAREQALDAERAAQLHGQREELDGHWREQLAMQEKALGNAHAAEFHGLREQLEADWRQQIARREQALATEHAAQMHGQRERLDADLRQQLVDREQALGAEHSAQLEGQREQLVADARQQLAAQAQGLGDAHAAQMLGLRQQLDAESQQRLAQREYVLLAEHRAQLLHVQQHLDVELRRRLAELEQALGAAHAGQRDAQRRELEQAFEARLLAHRDEAGKALDAQTARTQVLQAAHERTHADLQDARDELAAFRFQMAQQLAVADDSLQALRRSAAGRLFGLLGWTPPTLPSVDATSPASGTSGGTSADAAGSLAT